MPRLPRVTMPDHPHHVTHRGARGMPLFHDDLDRKLYIELLRKYATELGIDLQSWCLMTNHVHFVGVPKSTGSLSAALFRVHKKYAEAYNRKRGTTGNIFQSRFMSCVLDEPYFFAAMRYVLLNPVRAGMVTRPTEYVWSSARFLSGQANGDPLVVDRRPFGLDMDFECMLEQDPGELGILRKCTRIGCPLGSAGFVRQAFESQGFTGEALSKLCKLALKHLGVESPSSAEPVPSP